MGAFSTNASVGCPMRFSILAATFILTSASALEAITVSETKLTASDGLASQSFGSSLALSGDIAVISAPLHAGSVKDSGAAFVFDTSTGQETVFLSSNDPVEEDFFGQEVDVSGTTAIVSAHLGTGRAPGTGTAYLFDTLTGQQTAKLYADDGAATDLFGISVAISGDTVIIGASGTRDPGAYTGAAYFFDASDGSQRAKLSASDGAAGDMFGFSVDIEGEFALVGAPRADAAYLYDVSSGAEIAKLSPGFSASGSYFGVSVALSGELALIGAPYDTRSGVGSGAAYLYDLSSGAEIAKLTASDADEYALFGNAVAIDGETLLIGAQWDEENGANSGAAYVFDANTGMELAKIIASDGAPYDDFGYSVALFGNQALIGAPYQTSQGEYSGAAYLYEITGDVAPVPVPAAGWLLAMALGLLALRRQTG